MEMTGYDARVKKITEAKNSQQLHVKKCLVHDENNGGFSNNTKEFFF